jgi:hypothetical protein
MLAASPMLAPVEVEGARMEALAGRSADGGLVTVVLMNWGEDRQLDVEIVGLPWGSNTRFNWERHRTTRGSVLTSGPRGAGTGATFRTGVAVPGETVMVIRLARNDSAPRKD